LPDSTVNNSPDHEDALELAKQLGIVFYEMPIDKAVSSVEESLQWGQNKLAEMNLRARIRMVVLYDFANTHKALVVGTGNKSELMLGYFTKHGDGATDFLPLRNLFKTDVFGLARFKKLPEAIIGKKPSAGLFEGQTDEAELGAGYETIDAFLQDFEKGIGKEELAKKFGNKLTASLLQRIKASQHKR